MEQRAEIASQILHGLNAYIPDVEQAWMEEVERRAGRRTSLAIEARQRLDEFEQGKVKEIFGEQIMNELKSITEELIISISPVPFKFPACQCK